jgi:hypothetical protein
MLLGFGIAGGHANAQDCPTPSDEIATDRPDVTNSSLVVPFGSLQAENGVDWRVQHRSNLIDGTNMGLRLGIAHCTEFPDRPSHLFRLFEWLAAVRRL